MGWQDAPEVGKQGKAPAWQSAPEVAQKKQPAPKPSPRPSAGTAALNSLAAVGGAMWRGVSGLPDMMADVGDAVTGGVNALAHGRMPWEQDQNARPQNNFRLGDLPDKLGTPRPVAPGVEFTGQFLGGMATPMPTPVKKPGVRGPVRMATPKPANAAKAAARQTVQDGAEAGVRVLTTDVKPPKTFVGKTAQALGERIPYAGTGGVRQAQQAERIAAVKQLAQDFGAHEGEDAIDAVAKDLAATRGDELSRLTKQKNSVIKGLQGAVQTPQAVKAIDDQIAELTGINADAYAPLIQKLQGFKDTLMSGKNLSQIEGNRKLLGDLFKDGNLSAIAGDGQKALNAIYGPLRADMGNFIKAAGGEGAFAKWKNANDRLASMAGELTDSAFKGVLKSSDATPENVSRLLFSKKPSDVRRLYANLSPEGRAKAQAAVLHQALTKAGGFENVSPDKFTNQIEALGRTIGVHFQEPDRVRLEGLTRLLNVTQRASTAAAAPPTGVQNSIPIISAVLTDMMGGAGAAMTTGTVTGLIARAYESVPVRNALLRLGRTKAGSPQEAVQIERLLTAFSIASKPYVESLAAHANDNVGRAALAGDRPEDQQNQQAPLQP